MHDLKKSRFTIEMPIEAGMETYMALYQTMTGAFVLVPETVWPDIFNRPNELSDPELIDDLRDQGFLVKTDVDETAVFECWKQQHVHNYDTITSKVNVTRKCNNRCTYCILDYEAREMTPDTARAMDEFYLDTINHRRPLSVRDDYLGGEPLLNTGVLLASAARRFNHCRKNNIDYGFTITTNGVLLSRTIVSKMKAVSLAGIRVSLAGPAQVHDLLRPSATQGKTYGTIIKNLKSVSGMTPITIECQYDSGSTDYRFMPEMYDDFKKQNIVIDDIHFTPILKKRGECRFNTGLGDPGIALDLIKEARNYGYSSQREAPASLCRADFKAMFVFDTDGSIIPCPGLQEGEMAYGHVTKGVDFIAESQLLKRNLPDKCLNYCDLLPLCMGGCRQQALVYRGDFAGIDCQYDTQRLFLDDYIREMALGALSREEGAQEERAYEENTCRVKAA